MVGVGHEPGWLHFWLLLALRLLVLGVLQVLQVLQVFLMLSVLLVTICD